ncbi:mycothiol transferase [Nigerium massiliense]|uniref:mycothiol transferase n=1 Tax=Nigerium massiliense TaxID=1522317 RepID=UPI00058F046D|nr:DUF664 domain-containing protein [Nigerium massiliense]
MNTAELLSDAVERSREVSHHVLDGLSADLVNEAPRPGANPIGWLVWHLARQEDLQIADLAGTEPVWTSQGWAAKLALDLPDDAMGYGMKPNEVARVRITDTAALLGYLDATVEATLAYVATLDEGALDDIIDTNWDPPVTRGVRLISVVDDAAQHAGQAAYVRGLLEG